MKTWSMFLVGVLALGVVVGLTWNTPRRHHVVINLAAAILAYEAFRRSVPRLPPAGPLWPRRLRAARPQAIRDAANTEVRAQR